ncbi:MAG: DUF1992 domain-containing protein [Desulfobulbus sp.]|nr:DUF1992 domain-containing protein [Desulfobulbus sp.]
MLSIIQTIAERKIQQAMAEGTMPDLSHWKNKPMPPDDMANVPEDLRMAYRLLKMQDMSLKRWRCRKRSPGSSRSWWAVQMRRRKSDS